MHVFPITTYPWRALAAASALTIGLPLLIAAAALIGSAALPDWLFILALATALAWLLAVNFALVVLALYVATRNEITIRGGTMHLKGGEFHERVPLEAVVDARVVDVADRPDLARARRRNGIALPGFRVGWFETADGRKLFVLRAAGARLLHVTTDIRFDVLLGVDEPEALGQRLLSNRCEDRD
ncbi:hypothetical protein [Salinisphaera sp. T31B1]|uniref:hypothetical protein n=1 Tax=Salinisphaera sp. T31B1 TaxID=727963 RepID=UPI00334271D8